MSNELLDNIDYNMIIDDNEDNIQIEFASKIDKLNFVEIIKQKKRNTYIIFNHLT
jgi:hypothetical protein